MDRGYGDDVEAIVSFALDAKAAAAYAQNTQRSLESVRITGRRLAVHLERIGVGADARETGR